MGDVVVLRSFLGFRRRSKGEEPPVWGTPWTLEIGVSTDAGPERSVNEDCARVDAELGLLVVADGMGGHEAGEVASAVAVDTLFEYVRQAREDGDPPNPKVLHEAVTAANQLVIEKAAEGEGRKGMGTTLTALWLNGREYWIGHVGDTRAWRARKGAVDQITRDHSLVGDRVRSGLLSPAQAEVHPMRNVLTRALGNRAEVKVDLYRGEVLAADMFVLASDGLVKACGADMIERLLGEAGSVEAASGAMVRYACEHDGSDNVTVVVVRCGGADGAAETLVGDTTAIKTVSQSLGTNADAGSRQRDDEPLADTQRLSRTRSVLLDSSKNAH